MARPSTRRATISIHTAPTMAATTAPTANRPAAIIKHAAAAQCLGQLAGENGAYQRAERDCGGGETVLQRRHWEGVLERWTGDGDDALVVAEQQSGDRGDACQEVDHG